MLCICCAVASFRMRASGMFASLYRPSCRCAIMKRAMSVTLAW